MTSKAIVRSAEDIDEKALSYAEIKALAAGNPLIIEKTQLDAEVSKLKLLKQSHLSQIYALEDAIVKKYPIQIKQYQDQIKNIQKDIEIVKKSTNIDNKEKFSPMILQGKQYDKKELAGNTIIEICKNKTTKEVEEIGEYRGMKMYLKIELNNFVLTLQNNSIHSLELGKDVYGNITRIDNAIADMERVLEKTKINLDNTNKQFENAKKDVEAPFEKEQELQEKIARLAEVNQKLEIKDNENEIIEDVELAEEKEKNKEYDYDRDSVR